MFCLLQKPFPFSQQQSCPLQAEEVHFPPLLLASSVSQPPAHPDGPALESLQLVKTCVLLGDIKLDDAISICSLGGAKQRGIPPSVDLLARHFLVQLALQLQCTAYRKSLVALTRCFNILYVQGGDAEPKLTNSA